MTTATAAAVKERPIIFSGSMIRAILEGRKTQTRRVMNPQPPGWIETFGATAFTPHGHISGRGYWKGVPGDEGPAEKHFRSPYGCFWERLWVRETWKVSSESNNYPTDKKRLYIDYKAGPAYTAGFGQQRSVFSVEADEALAMAAWGKGKSGRWRPSIHMPRWASRIDLEIVSVRVERLQSISEVDAIAEGLKCLSKDGGQTWKYGIPETDGWPGPDGMQWSDWDVDPRKAFRRLWDSINAQRGYGWEANPWVWVVEFRPITNHE